MGNPLDTHTYDGKIDISLLSNLPSVMKLHLEEKKRRGAELIHASRMNKISLRFLINIIISMGTLANIDPNNGLSADDLICLCWDKRYNDDFMKLFEEQLQDMTTGFCPVGRTHRLFQTLIAFE